MEQDAYRVEQEQECSKGMTAGLATSQGAAGNRRPGAMHVLRLALDSMLGRNVPGGRELEVATPPCTATEIEDGDVPGHCAASLCPSLDPNWKSKWSSDRGREGDKENVDVNEVATPSSSSDEDETMDVEFCLPYPTLVKSTDWYQGTPAKRVLEERSKNGLLCITTALDSLREAEYQEVSKPCPCPCPSVCKPNVSLDPSQIVCKPNVSSDEIVWKPNVSSDPSKPNVSSDEIVWKPNVPSDPSQIVDRIPPIRRGGPPAPRPTHRPIYSQLAGENARLDPYVHEPVHVSGRPVVDLNHCNSTTVITSAYNTAFDRLNQLRRQMKQPFLGNEEPAAVYNRRLEPRMEQTIHQSQVIRALVDQFFFYKNLDEYLYDVEDLTSEVEDLQATQSSMQRSASKSPMQQHICQKIAKLEVSKTAAKDEKELAKIQETIHDLFEKARRLQNTLHRELASVRQRQEERRLELESAIARRDDYIRSALPSHMALDDVRIPSYG